ncbi:hypothetical protein AVEN_23547-1 [Araneus ventricosus]|uniref:Mos1 transposase HTH domain-containing protein n=1 Tax=Araneus ventricosus TaxID=182803 RepID=A0A4Y2H803_ARAVE|nr:hypothetical protein AVEN_23547-1 [Araneus ventricosus]
MCAVVQFFIVEKVPQRICMEFCQKLGDTCGETYAEWKKVYGEDHMSRARVCYFFQNVSNVAIKVSKVIKSKHSQTSKNSGCEFRVRENRRITIYELPEK